MENKPNVEQIAQEITAQYVAQTQLAEQAALLEQQQKLKASKRMLRNKAMLWMVTGIVMTASLMYLGVAWYTRISNTHAVTFEVADYELAVNDNTENEFLVNLYSYQNIENQHAAPGTDGYIPLRISGRHSEIDIEYSLYMESMLAPELKNHIRFFVLVWEDDGSPVVCDLEDVLDNDGKPTGEKQVKEEHQQYFLKSLSEQEGSQLYKLMYPEGVQEPTTPLSTEPDTATVDEEESLPETETPPTPTPTPKPRKIVKKYVDIESTDELEATLKGTLEFSTQKMIYIYWEWYLDAKDAISTVGNGFYEEKVEVKDSEGKLTGEYKIECLTEEKVADKLYNELITEKNKEENKDNPIYKDIPEVPEEKVEAPKDEDGNLLMAPDKPVEPEEPRPEKEPEKVEKATQPDPLQENPTEEQQKTYDDALAAYEKYQKYLEEKKAYDDLIKAWETYDTAFEAYQPFQKYYDYMAQVEAVAEYKKELWNEFAEAWDAVDTDVGRYPQKYKEAMIFHITCEGAQSVPEVGGKDSETEETS